MQYKLIIDNNYQLLAIYRKENLVKVFLFCEEFEKPYRIYLASLNRKVSGIGGQIFSTKLGSNNTFNLFLKSDKKISSNKKSYLSFRNQPFEEEKLAIARLSPLIISKYHSLERKDGIFEVIEKKKQEATSSLPQALIDKDKLWLKDQISSFSQTGLIYSGLDIYQTALILANDHDEIIVNDKESLFKLKQLTKEYWPNLSSSLSYAKINLSDIRIDIDSCLLRACRFNREIEAIFEETSIGLNIDLNLALNTTNRKVSRHHTNFKIITGSLELLFDQISALNYTGRHLIDVPFIKGNDRKKLVLEIRGLPYQFGSISFTNSGILEVIIDNPGYPLALTAKQIAKMI